MSLRRFYGDTGLMSARATGLIYFGVEVVAYIIIGVYALLIYLHIVKPDPKRLEFDWEDFEESMAKADEEILKEKMAKKKKEHDLRNSSKRGRSRPAGTKTKRNKRVKS